MMQKKHVLAAFNRIVHHTLSQKYKFQDFESQASIAIQYFTTIIKRSTKKTAPIQLIINKNILRIMQRMMTMS